MKVSPPGKTCWSSSSPARIRSLNIKIFRSFMAIYCVYTSCNNCFTVYLNKDEMYFNREIQFIQRQTNCNQHNAWTSMDLNAASSTWFVWTTQDTKKVTDSKQVKRYQSQKLFSQRYWQYEITACVMNSCLSSVSFIRILPSVEKTMKDMRSWGLKRESIIGKKKSYYIFFFLFLDQHAAVAAKLTLIGSSRISISYSCYTSCHYSLALKLACSLLIIYFLDSDNSKLLATVKCTVIEQFNFNHNRTTS